MTISEESTELERDSQQIVFASCPNVRRACLNIQEQS